MALLVPIVGWLVGYYVQQSISSVQVGPEYTRLAIDILGRDPMTQPAGAREWAVELLCTYSGFDPESQLAKDLKAGWGLENDRVFVGWIRLDLHSMDVASATLDQRRFELRAQRAGPDEVGSVELSYPAEGKVVTVDRLSPHEVLRIHEGFRVYLFRLEGMDDRTAEFSVWKQFPEGAREADEPSEPIPAPMSR